MQSTVWSVKERARRALGFQQDPGVTQRLDCTGVSSANGPLKVISLTPPIWATRSLDSRLESVNALHNGGFEGVIMAMKILEGEQSDPEMKSLISLSLDKLQILKALSKELVSEVERLQKA